LRQRFPQSDAHLHDMTVIDCLLNYHGRPTQYDPLKLSLFSYLRMSARNDMLNVLNQHTRYDKQLVDIDDPHVQTLLPEEDLLTDTGNLDEWLSQHTRLTRQQILKALDDQLTKTDKKVVLLMLDGVRDNRQFATAMGLTHLDTGQQRAEVKRAKDRLTKKLQRFGNQLDTP
jgi:DNA-directed RNA polymerase specialized sigma24 family protein